MPRAVTTTTASPVLRVAASATHPTRTGLTMKELYPAAVVTATARPDRGQHASDQGREVVGGNTGAGEQVMDLAEEGERHRRTAEAE